MNVNNRQTADREKKEDFEGNFYSSAVETGREEGFLGHNESNGMSPNIVRYSLGRSDRNVIKV